MQKLVVGLIIAVLVVSVASVGMQDAWAAQGMIKDLFPPTNDGSKRGVGIIVEDGNW